MATPTAEPGGLLLVDKPAGLTSHDVVSIVRRVLKTRRVGHAGTLDPFATGLLVILFGRGTRLIPYVDGEPKVYQATILLGTETDTDDLTGTRTRTAELPSDDAIDRAIAQLTGAIDQVPPDYSAKQVEGTRAYAAARRGAPLELRPVPVTVYHWSAVERDGDRIRARITCSGGTYIRALARDLGRLSGSAAHLAELRRTDAGAFSVDDAVTIAGLKDGEFSVRSLASAIPALPVQQLDADDLRRVVHGNPIASHVDGLRVALVDDEHNLIAVADAEQGELRPKLVLRDA